MEAFKMIDSIGNIGYPIMITGAIVLFLILICISIRIVSQTRRGVVERLGKFNRISQPGINIIIPIIEHMNFRNITEQMTDVEPQDIITKDNLNARVDLQVYYKVKDDKESIYNSYYKVNDYKVQIISLAKTTARNVIGDMKFVEVNSQRSTLNQKLAETMANETSSWGVDIVRVELKEITPPKDVQDTMNAVIKAQNSKDAAIDTATALETQADGQRRAAIKVAEGEKQSKILKAEGEAEAIKLVNEAAEKFFKGNAQILKKLETVEKSLTHNSKIIVPAGSSLTNLIGSLTGLENER